MKKNGRTILIDSCLACLFIGLVVGYITDYPKRPVIVSVELPPHANAGAEINTNTTDLKLSGLDQ